MKIFDEIKYKLDNLENNIERKNYLESIQKNPNIGRHDLRRIACNTMVETNFTESYYKISFEENLKTRIKKMVSFKKKIF